MRSGDPDRLSRRCSTGRDSRGRRARSGGRRGAVGQIDRALGQGAAVGAGAVGDHAVADAVAAVDPDRRRGLIGSGRRAVVAGRRRGRAGLIVGLRAGRRRRRGRRVAVTGRRRRRRAVVAGRAPNGRWRRRRWRRPRRRAASRRCGWPPACQLLSRRPRRRRPPIRGAADAAAIGLALAGIVVRIAGAADRRGGLRRGARRQRPAPERRPWRLGRPWRRCEYSGHGYPSLEFSGCLLGGVADPLWPSQAEQSLSDPFIFVHLG